MPVRNTSLAAGIFNLSKSAVGTGTLGLAFCMKEMGLGLGLSMMIFAAFMASVSLHFLGRLSANTDCSSYFGLGRLSFGAAGETSAIAALSLFLIGGLTFYAWKIGVLFSASLKFMLPSHKDSIFLNEAILTIISGTLLVFPLSV